MKVSQRIIENKCQHSISNYLRIDVYINNSIKAENCSLRNYARSGVVKAKTRRNYA